MIEAIDIGLEAFLRACPELTTDIDVSFEAPDREWSAKVGTRPTVNLFLWDIRRSAERAQSGLTTVTDADGRRVHKQPLPVAELFYVVTVWAPLHADERRLLSGLTREALASPSIDRDYLPASIQHLDEPEIRVGVDTNDHIDVMKVTDGKVKTGFHLVVTTQIDTERSIPAEVAVADVALDFRQMHRRVAGEIAHATKRRAVGAVVRSPFEQTKVNSAGQFLVEAAPGDEIVIESEPPLVVTVPAAGGIRIE